ncbi:hypothetical protein ACFVH9_05645 [Streptomyces hirsutus]|uniref:hypothetical protein n=1 Tax=Streptomyces hirsutus TaxID=35620 RepID=UPI003640AABC
MAEDVLLAIVDEAVAAQPVADRVVAARGRPGPVSGAVTQTGGEQISVYHKLNVRLSRLSSTTASTSSESGRFGSSPATSGSCTRR